MSESKQPLPPSSIRLRQPAVYPDEEEQIPPPSMSLRQPAVGGDDVN